MGIAPFHLQILQCFDMNTMQVLVKGINTKVILEEVMAKYCQFDRFWRIELLGEASLYVCVPTDFSSTKIFPTMNIAHFSQGVQI